MVVCNQVSALVARQCGTLNTAEDSCRLTKTACDLDLSQTVLVDLEQHHKLPLIQTTLIHGDVIHVGEKAFRVFLVWEKIVSEIKERRKVKMKEVF